MNSKKFAKFALIAMPFIAPLAQADKIIYQVNAATFGMTLLSGTLGFNTALNAGKNNFDKFDLTISGANGGDSFLQYSTINGGYTQTKANSGVFFTNNEVQFTQSIGISGISERISVDLLFANPVTASTKTDGVLASSIAYFDPTTNTNTLIGLSSAIGSASISAVPAPAAVWLFGTGLMGFLYSGKYKQKLAKA
jgi:hypothetical protein